VLSEQTLLLVYLVELVTQGLFLVESDILSDVHVLPRLSLLHELDLLAH